MKALLYLILFISSCSAVAKTKINVHISPDQNMALIELDSQGQNMFFGYYDQQKNRLIQQILPTHLKVPYLYPVDKTSSEKTRLKNQNHKSFALIPKSSIDSITNAVKDKKKIEVNIIKNSNGIAAEKS